MCYFVDKISERSSAYQQNFVFGSLLISLTEAFWAQNRLLVIFTFETFSVMKKKELSRKSTQKMKISEAQKYQLVEFVIVVLTLVDNVHYAQDIT